MLCLNTFNLHYNTTTRIIKYVYKHVCFFFSLCVYVDIYLICRYFFTYVILLTYLRYSTSVVVLEIVVINLLKMINIVNIKNQLTYAVLWNRSILHIFYTNIQCNNILCIMKYAYLILEYANKYSIKNNLNMFKYSM